MKWYYAILLGVLSFIIGMVTFLFVERNMAISSSYATRTIVPASSLPPSETELSPSQYLQEYLNKKPECVTLFRFEHVQLPYTTIKTAAASAGFNTELDIPHDPEESRLEGVCKSRWGDNVQLISLVKQADKGYTWAVAITEKNMPSALYL